MIKGEILDRYDKRLLAGTGTELEHLFYAPGNRPVVFNIRGVNCGMLICHEWRYPELYRQYKGMKTDLIFQSWYDGKVSGKLSRNRSGVLISEIDLEHTFADPSAHLRDRLKD